jgi:UDP:flavonoid glycosyltransferase YjiC (YdhE family)
MILFCMHQEVGHLNCTFKLARELKRRGHEVSYCAVPDIEPRIAAEGFGVVPWFPDLFPAGHVQHEAGQGLLQRRRAISQRYVTMAQRLLAGELAQVLERARLVLVDVNEPLTAMLCAKLGVRCVLVSTALPQTITPGVPPVRSGASYRPDWLGRIQARLRWQQLLLKRRVAGHLARLLGACPPYLLVEQLAPRFGMSVRDLDASTLYMPQPRGLPELVLCPQAFDFVPSGDDAGRAQCESVDLDRREADFPWDSLDLAKPLVYCAVGTNAYRTGDVLRFFEAFCDVMRRHPQWQGVLAVGRHRTSVQAPDNVVVVQNAPQLGLLRKAAVMISHCGLGSVKEAMVHAVPVVAIPLTLDQPGNAARIAYHGVGVAGNVQCTAAELEAWIARGLSDAVIRRNVQAMQARFQRVESAGGGAQFVETYMAGADAAARATR